MHKSRVPCRPVRTKVVTYIGDKNMAEPLVVNVAEAAEMLAVSQRTMWKWIHQRKIESIVIGVNRKIKIKEIHRFLDDNTVPTRR